MGPQDPKDVAGQVAPDLTQLTSDLSRTKADANHWLEDPEYAALKHRLEDAHAALEPALIEARRRARKP
jgi:hypothetical protein